MVHKEIHYTTPKTLGNNNPTVYFTQSNITWHEMQARRLPTKYVGSTIPSYVRPVTCAYLADFRIGILRPLQYPGMNQRILTMAEKGD